MSTPSEYTFAYPEQGLSPKHVAFLEQFYQTSDDPNGSREYADVFVEDAELVMMGKQVKGREGEWLCFSSSLCHLLKQRRD